MKNVHRKLWNCQKSQTHTSLFLENSSIPFIFVVGECYKSKNTLWANVCAKIFQSNVADITIPVHNGYVRNMLISREHAFPKWQAFSGEAGDRTCMHPHMHKSV